MRALFTRMILMLLTLPTFAGGAEAQAAPGAANTQAQTTPTSTTQAKTAPIADYVLGADDVIEISVRNHSELDKTLTILPDGKISFPDVGEVQAAGKTPRALAGELQTELEKTRNNVGVSVAVKEIHSRRVRVVGAVKTPGLYDVKPNWRLMDVVAVAGGFNARPALMTGRLIRGGTRVFPLNLTKADAQPDDEANVRLEPDDLVLLDQQEKIGVYVHVIGQVAKPGAYELDDNLTLLSLTAQAGNPTDKAALSKAYVIRDGAQIPLDLHKILVEGKGDETLLRFKFQPRDVLFIPENDKRYAVMGQVRTTGYFPLPETGDVTALTALNLAGSQPDSDLSHAGIIRIVDGKATAQPVNLASILKKGAVMDNPTLQPGDILYIPARSTKRSLNDVLSPLSLLSVLGFRLFR